MGAVEHVRHVRAKVPRRRAVRARVGVLEGALGAAGGGPTSAYSDDGARERFTKWRAL